MVCRYKHPELKCLLTLVLVLYSFAGYTQSEFVKITSLDGNPCAIQIVDDYGHGHLIFRYKDDSVCISGVTEVYSHKILDGKFLLCEYVVRGGTGVGIRRTVMICLPKNRLYTSFNVMSYLFGEMDMAYDKVADSLKLFDEHQLYETSFSYSDFSITVNIHDYLKSKYDPRNNRDIYDTAKLKFDNKKNIFYSEFEQFGGEYLVPSFDGSEMKADTLRLNYQKYPAIKLSGNRYYFINDRWYERGNSNYLLRL